MFLNGVSDCTPLAVTGNVTNYAGQPAYMGRIEILAPVMDGEMDEVMFFDTDLPETDIRRVMLGLHPLK